MQLMPISIQSQNLQPQPTSEDIAQPAGMEREFSSVLEKQAGQTGKSTSRGQETVQNGKHAKEKFSNTTEERSAAQTRISDEKADTHSKVQQGASSDSREAKESDVPHGKEAQSDMLTPLLVLLGMLGQQSEQLEGEANRTAELILSGVFENPDHEKLSVLDELIEKFKKLLELSGNHDTNSEIQKIQSQIDSVFAVLLSKANSSNQPVTNSNITLGEGMEESDMVSWGKIYESVQTADAAESELSSSPKGIPSKDIVPPFPENNETGGSKPVSSTPPLEAHGNVSTRKTQTTVDSLTLSGKGNQRIDPEGKVAKTQTCSCEPDANIDLQQTDGTQAARGMDKKNLSSMETKNFQNIVSGKNNSTQQSTITTLQEGTMREDSSTTGKKSSGMIFDFRPDVKSSEQTKEFSLPSANGLTVDRTADPAINNGNFPLNSLDADVSVPEPELRTNVMDQISHGISRSIALNRNRAVIHLNPPELGSVTIRISVGNNNSVHASFVTEHAHTNQLLQSGMETLKIQLAQNGFDLGQVNINLNNSGMNDAHTFHRGHSQKRDGSFASKFSKDGEDRVIEVPATGKIVPDHGGTMHIVL